MTKIKFAIETEDCTELLGIDLEKISCFLYDGVSVQLWMDGAPEPIVIQKSEVQNQAFSQLLGALEDEFPELYGDEFPDRMLDAGDYNPDCQYEDEDIPKFVGNEYDHDY